MFKVEVLKARDGIAILKFSGEFNKAPLVFNKDTYTLPEKSNIVWTLTVDLNEYNELTGKKETRNIDLKICEPGSAAPPDCYKVIPE
jgi:hypothetical protein